MAFAVDTAEIQNHLGVLVNGPLWGSGRAANLQWFQFGERRLVSDRKGRPKEVGEWALHVQCAWRICDSREIIVGSADRFVPKDSADDKREGFDWDRPGVNLCDHRISQLAEECFPLSVQAVDAARLGTFRITFEEGFALEVFADSSRVGGYAESWRLFRPYSDDQHFVVAGGSIAKH